MPKNKIGDPRKQDKDRTKNEGDSGETVSFDSGLSWGELKWHMKFAGRQLRRSTTWLLLALAFAVLASAAYMSGMFSLAS